MSFLGEIIAPGFLLNYEVMMCPFSAGRDPDMGVLGCQTRGFPEKCLGDKQEECENVSAL